MLFPLLFALSLGNAFPAFADEEEDEAADVSEVTEIADVSEVSDDTNVPKALDVTYAAKITKNNGTEESYATLQEAVNVVEAGETITLLTTVYENISSSGKTYTLEMNGLTVNGGQAGCVYTITGGTVTIRNGTLTNGKNTAWGASSAGGGLKASNAVVILNGMTISNSSSNNSGGGIYCSNSEITITDSTLSNNTASQSGGGLYTNNTANLTNVRFEGNYAPNGGSALYVNNDIAAFSGCSFTENYGNSGMGCSIIRIEENIGYGGTITFENCKITDNYDSCHTFYASGGNYLGNNPLNVTLTGCEISGNKALLTGGVFVNDFCTLTLEDTVIKENNASGGSDQTASGGVNCNPGSDNKFVFSSGAIYNNTVGEGGANDLFLGHFASISIIAANAMSDGNVDFSQYYVWNKSSGGDIDADIGSEMNAESDLFLKAIDISNIPTAKYKNIRYDTIQQAIEAAKADNEFPALIQLMPVINNSGSGYIRDFSTDEVTTIDIPVILDLNECDLHVKGNTLFEVTTAEGSLTLRGKGDLSGLIDVKNDSTLTLDSDTGDLKVRFGTDKASITVGKNFIKCGDISIKMDEPDDDTAGTEQDTSRAKALNGFNGSGTDFSSVIIYNGKGKIDIAKVTLTNVNNPNAKLLFDGNNMIALNPTFGDGLFVSSKNGDNENEGSHGKPLKTLKSAVDKLNDANKSGTIYFEGTFEISGFVELIGKGNTITIQRYSDDPNSDLKCENMIEIKSGGSLTLENITIDGGSNSYKNAGSMILVRSGGTLKIGNGTTLQNNDVSKSGNSYNSHLGGAVYASGGNIEIEISDGSIIDNCSALQGGGIFCRDGKITMNGGTIQKCKATGTLPVGDSENNYYYASGGGIAIIGNAEMTMNGGRFEYNTATYGGGVSVGTGQYSVERGSNTDPAFIMKDPKSDTNNVMRLAANSDDESAESGNIFFHNISLANGGGLFVQSTYRADIYSGVFRENECRGGNYGGGAIYVNGGKAIYDKYGNFIKEVRDGELVLKGVLIRNNTANQFGGGIAGCNTSGTIIERLNGSVIYGNTATNTFEGEGEQLPSDISTSTHATSVNQFTGIKHPQTNDHFLQYMLDGKPYYWRSAIDVNGFSTGELVSEDYLNSNIGKAIYTDEKPSENIVDSEGNIIDREAIKVVIEDNKSYTSGGGIGSNGSIFIGDPYQETWLYKQPQDDYTVQKIWKDTDGQVLAQDYPANLEQLNIWLFGVDNSSGKVQRMIHNPMIKNSKLVVYNGNEKGKVGFEPLENGLTPVLLEEAIYTDGRHVWSDNGKVYEDIIRDIICKGKNYIFSDDDYSPFTSMLSAPDNNGNYIFTNQIIKVPVKISKVDISDNALLLPGAKLVIKDSSDNVIDSWTSSDISGKSPHETELIPGKYKIVEEKAPDGYKRIRTHIEFTVKKDGTITVISHENAEKSADDVILVKNELIPEGSEPEPDTEDPAETTPPQPEEPKPAEPTQPKPSGPTGGRPSYSGNSGNAPFVNEEKEADEDSSAGNDSKAEDIASGSGPGFYRESEIGSGSVVIIAVAALASMTVIVVLTGKLRRRKK